MKLLSPSLATTDTANITRDFQKIREDIPNSRVSQPTFSSSNRVNVCKFEIV